MASHVKKPSGRTQISKKCLLGRQWIRWKSQWRSHGTGRVISDGCAGTSSNQLVGVTPLIRLACEGELSTRSGLG